MKAPQEMSDRSEVPGKGVFHHSCVAPYLAKGRSFGRASAFRMGRSKAFGFFLGEIRVNILPNPNFAGPFVGFYVFKNWGR